MRRCAWLWDRRARFAERIDLNAMPPRNDFASSGYCLANPGVEYLVYMPDDDRVEVYLGIEPKRFRVEWFHVLSGETVQDEPLEASGLRLFTSPFGLDACCICAQSRENGTLIKSDLADHGGSVALRITSQVSSPISVNRATASASEFSTPG